MCILSGCDYLPSLPGIGLGKSFKFFSRQTANDNADINKVIQFISQFFFFSFFNEENRLKF